MKPANHSQVRPEHGLTKEKGRNSANCATPEEQITERHFSTTTKGEARLDSRLIAQHLGIKHRNLFELVESHKSDFAELGMGINLRGYRPAHDLMHRCEGNVRGASDTNRRHGRD